MRIDVLEKVARAAGFAGACDDDLQADPPVQGSPDIPAPRTAVSAPSTALAIVDARAANQPMQATATWLATAPANVARSLTTLLGRGAPA